MSKIFLKADQIDAAVRELYSKNGLTVLSQVRNGTGYERRTVRTADMLMVSTWPSRGLYCEGVEIKVSRGDLQRELENPAKADDIAKFCTRWWLAVPEGLTEGCMVPPTWGVIEVDGKLKAKVAKQAGALDAIPMDTLFVCSVLRNFGESYIPKHQVQPEIEKAKKDSEEAAKVRESYQIKHLRSTVDLYVEKLTEFRDKTGIDLLTGDRELAWDVGRIGDAVKLIVEFRGRPIDQMLNAKKALAMGIDAIDAALGPLATEAAAR